jgi:hypothetical protein
MFSFRTVYGHVGGRVWSRGRVRCSTMDASLESFGCVLVECYRYYEQRNTWHACVGTARGQQYPQLHKDLSTSHRDRPSTVTGFVVEARTYLRVSDPGLHNIDRTSPQQPRIHSRGWSTCYNVSIRFTLIRSVGQYNSAELCWLDGRVCRVRFYNTLSKSRDQGR